MDEARDVRSPAEQNTLPASRLFTPDQLMLRFLTPAQVQLIEEALKEVGPFGEVRLVEQKGRLRFVETLKSKDALKTGF